MLTQDKIKASSDNLKVIELNVKTLNHFKGQLPKYETTGASGFDIKVCLDKDFDLAPGKRVLLGTGLSFEVPPGFELQCRPRSGLALKKGLTVLNTPGTIDSDYRGEIKVLVFNASQKNIRIKDQDRIAQLVLCPVYKVKLRPQARLTKSQRGGGGFGSTGV
ncbi:MAG: dUTP diphosphatase [Bdellovibrionales bacterium]|nr:dUTP diphosphatase [Bdellovibrionales bacterium]